MSDSTPSPGARWQSERADALCARGARYVTGADMVRIARTLALEPWHFTQTSPATVSDPTGIVLDEGRRRVNLRLANASHGCVFLIRTLEGTGRCGLGELAPIACRVFPEQPNKPRARDAPPGDTAGPGAADADRQRAGSLLDQEQLAEARGRWAADRDLWFEIIKRWKAVAEDARNPSDIEDFQRYLLEAQTARETGSDWPEDVTA